MWTPPRPPAATPWFRLGHPAVAGAVIGARTEAHPDPNAGPVISPLPGTPNTRTKTLWRRYGVWANERRS